LVRKPDKRKYRQMLYLLGKGWFRIHSFATRDDRINVLNTVQLKAVNVDIEHLEKSDDS
jgi:hypothetical protein